MRLIESSVEVLEQGSGLDGIYKQIERAGRTCYKSEDKITEDSAKEFVDRMIKLGHGAMLEHGTVYLTKPTYSSPYPAKYSKTKYTNQQLITTNLRVLVEDDRLEDLKYLTDKTEHEPRITVKFTCDRGVSHEFVRHRVFSFAQESTRYCNYSNRDKFGNEIIFIKPCFLDYRKLALYGPYHTVIRDKSPESIFIASLNNAEKDYIDLIDLGWKPQEARAVLPNALKTELVMTGFASDWVHFFELRCAKNAHPDARKLAIEALSKLYKLYPNYFEELYDKYCRQEG